MNNNMNKMALNEQKFHSYPVNDWLFFELKRNLILIPMEVVSANIKIVLYMNLKRFFIFAVAEIEAKEACEWLRAAGFPQYAQLFEGKPPPTRQPRQTLKVKPYCTNIYFTEASEWLHGVNGSQEA